MHLGVILPGLMGLLLLGAGLVKVSLINQPKILLSPNCDILLVCNC